MEKKMRLSHWIQGFGVSMLIFLLWSNTGPTVEISRIESEESGDTRAIRELASQIKKHPLSNKFTVRSSEVSPNGQQFQNEFYYNRLIHRIEYKVVGDYYRAPAICYQVRDWMIVSAALAESDWFDKLNSKGCRCDRNFGPIP